MPTIQVKANFPNGGFGFYQSPEKGSIGDRKRDGDVFPLYYDDDFPLEAAEVNGKKKKGQLAEWMIKLEEPKKKPGPKPKEIVTDGDNELRNT